MIRVSGLDLSWTSTGLSAGPHGETCVIKTTTKDVPEKRLVTIRDEVLMRVGSAQIIVMEGYSFGAKARREQAGELGGVVKTALWEAGIPVVLIPPARLKKFQTGAGNARKEQGFAEWCHRTGRLFVTNDEADAHALWFMGMCMYNPKAQAVKALTLPQDHMEALKQWPEVVPRNG